MQVASTAQDAEEHAWAGAMHSKPGRVKSGAQQVVWPHSALALSKLRTTFCRARLNKFEVMPGMDRLIPGRAGFWALLCITRGCTPWT